MYQCKESFPLWSFTVRTVSVSPQTHHNSFVFSSRSGSPDITKQHDLFGNTADLLKKYKSKEKKEFKSYSDSEECVKKKKKQNKGCQDESPFKEKIADRQKKKKRKYIEKESIEEGSNFNVKKKKARKDRNETLANDSASEEKESYSKKKKRRRKNKSEKIPKIIDECEDKQTNLSDEESNWKKKKGKS